MSATSRSTGRDVSHLRWYQALALWKSAVFCEAIYGRHLRGEHEEPWAASLCDGVPRLIEVGARVPGSGLIRAAVDVQRLARHPGGLLAAHVADQAGDLVGLEEAPDLLLAQQAPRRLLEGHVERVANLVISSLHHLRVGPPGTIALAVAPCGASSEAITRVRPSSACLRHLDRRTNAWALLPIPADVEPGANAGTGVLRSKVAVSADGVGVITWGEQGVDGRTHVLARKVFGMSLSTAPQDLTLPTGGSADTPDVDAEDDSSFAWVTFRQTIDGVSRTLARRQRGTAFDDAVFTDGGNAAVEPRVAISGRGEGLLRRRAARAASAASCSTICSATRSASGPVAGRSRPPRWRRTATA